MFTRTLKINGIKIRFKNREQQKRFWQEYNTL